MGTALLEPPSLLPGARVALVSPAGPLAGRHELEHAMANATAMGWAPVAGTHALSRDGYFAGDDAARAHDLLEALTDPTIAGIWCLRGGYGAARLLPSISVELVRAHPKTLIGYSDITALHALWQRAGLVSYHGPTARAALTDFTRASLVETMGNVPRASVHALTMPDATTLRTGAATGRLAGGNLALVASLCGTPWAIDFRGAIVVLEDIGEATYRLDRMLLQLWLAGAFDGCAGLLLGQFTNCTSESDDGARTISAVMTEFASRAGVPAVLGAPVGHVADQWTLPLGAVATLDATTRTLRIHRAHEEFLTLTDTGAER
ncbi:MAG TPA: LD-carboxypeptidase [Gemmatimonas sp.]|nr:LD-carboxypeptidase [Gemmatimonas sp.]